MTIEMLRFCLSDRGTSLITKLTAILVFFFVFVFLNDSRVIKLRMVEGKIYCRVCVFFVTKQYTACTLWIPHISPDQIV